MASLADTQNEEKCPICFEEFHTPRKLPGCLHSFCETCILTFISDLKKEDKLGSEFECPVCRLPSQAPGNDDVLQRWIGSLETNKELDQKVVPDYAELQDCGSDCCGQCHDLKKTVDATKYCLACQEFYCSTCSDTLHAFRVNRNHAIIDTLSNNSERLHVQAVKMLKGFIMCSEHPKMPLLLYCQDDKMLCCTSCSIDRHKNCKHVKHITKSKHQVMDATKLVDLTVCLRQHIAGIITIIRAYDAESKEQLDKIESEFQEIKQKVIKILDVMEDNLRQEAKAAVKDIAMKRQDEVDGLTCMRNTLDTVHYLFETFLGNMSPEQTFACILGAEHILEDIEMTLASKGDSIPTESVALTTTEMLEQVLNMGPNETSQLASISRADADIAITRYEDGPFKRKYELKKIGMYKVLPVASGNTVTIEKPVYDGLKFSHDNKILLVDAYYGFVCFINEDFVPTTPYFHLCGELSSTFGNERYVTFVRDDVLALSIPAQRKIVLLTADEDFETKGEIECIYKPKALHGLENGDIAVAWDKPVAFGILSSQIWSNTGTVYYGKRRCKKYSLSYCEKIYFTEDQSGRKLTCFLYMAIDDDRHHVIQPCQDDKAVYCFDFEGRPVFEYTSDELESPTDVAIDREGNVYICESVWGCIHIISPDGLPLFIMTEDVPKEPLAIGFNKNNGTLAVTQSSGEDGEEGSVHLFSVVSKLC